MVIELGQKVRERLTGFAGIVAGYAKYLNAEDVRYLVQPEGLTASGNPRDAHWFDGGQLDTAND